MPEEVYEIEFVTEAGEDHKMKLFDNGDYMITVGQRTPYTLTVGDRAVASKMWAALDVLWKQLDKMKGIA